MKRTSKVISIILSVLMLMQMMTGVVFAADQDLVWTCEDLGQKNVDVHHGKEPYSDILGVRFTDKSTNKYGTMDKNGNIIIPATYDNIIDFYGDQCISVMINREVGIVNSKQEFVVEFGRYDMISKFNDTSFIAEKDKKFGIVSTNDEVIVDLIYDSMDTTADGNILACKDNKYSITLCNGFSGEIDMSKIWKKGYSSKGKNRGQGLPIVKKLIDAHPEILINTEIKNNLFVQDLTIIKGE